MPQNTPYDSADDADVYSSEDNEPVRASDSPTRSASLIGFDEGEGRFGEADADIAAAGDEEVNSPRDAGTQRNIASNPYAKAGVIGSTMALGFAGFGLLASGLFFRGQPPAPLRPPSQTAQNPVARPTRNPEGDLQAQVALLRQQQALDALKNKRTEPKKAAATQPITINQPAPQPSPIVIRDPAPSPRPTITVRPEPERPFLPPVAIPTQDPQEAWLTASRLGSYGQVSSPQREAESGDGDSIAADPLLEESVLTGQRAPSVQLIAGTKSKGVLVTPVAWDATASSGKDNRVGVEKFVIELKDPLKGADGAIALPKGTRLITQINGYSSSGLVDLSVKSAIVNVNGSQQEVRIPDNTLEVSGSGGKPLVAKLQTQGKNPLGLSRGALVQGVLGAASGATEELTKSNINVTTAGDSTSITTQNNRDVPAGAVKGGSKELINAISAQNQANISRQSRQAPASYWFTKAGTTVEVIVTQSTQIRGVAGGNATKTSEQVSASGFSGSF
jgi:hypothetical protein